MKDRWWGKPTLVMLEPEEPTTKQRNAYIILQRSNYSPLLPEITDLCTVWQCEQPAKMSVGTWPNDVTRVLVHEIHKISIPIISLVSSRPASPLLPSPSLPPSASPMPSQTQHPSHAAPPAYISTPPPPHSILDSASKPPAYNNYPDETGNPCSAVRSAQETHRSPPFHPRLSSGIVDVCCPYYFHVAASNQRWISDGLPEFAHTIMCCRVLSVRSLRLRKQVFGSILGFCHEGSSELALLDLNSVASMRNRR